MQAFNCSSVASPRTIASSSLASSLASVEAAARSRSPGPGRDIAITAAVPTTEASHQPASRSGTIEIVPGDAAGSTYGSSAAVTPAAALGPRMPPKNTANVTGTVTIAASATDELTAVPIAINTEPTTASPVCAISLSRRVPAKLARTSVANEPNA